jgi:hypothetical protein
MAKHRPRRTSTKASRRQPGRRGTARRLPKAPPPLEVLTRIIITKTGVVHPNKIVTFRIGLVAWLIQNVSGATHSVIIDPTKFKPGNPLSTDDPLVAMSVPDKSNDLLMAFVRDDADLGS